MAGIDFRKWQSRTILAVILALFIFGAVFMVTPIYGLNISPANAQGSSLVGGWFGELVPTTQQNAVQPGYAGG